MGGRSGPSRNFRDLAAAGIIVLLVLLLIMNAVAIYLRQRFSQEGALVAGARQAQQSGTVVGRGMT